MSIQYDCIALSDVLVDSFGVTEILRSRHLAEMFLCPFTESGLIWLDVARPVRTECTKAGEPAATTYHRFDHDNPRRQGMAISVLRVLPPWPPLFPLSKKEGS